MTPEQESSILTATKEKIAIFLYDCLNHRIGNGYNGWSVPHYSGFFIQFAGLDDNEKSVLMKACEEMESDLCLIPGAEDRSEPSAAVLTFKGIRKYIYKSDDLTTEAEARLIIHRIKEKTVRWLYRCQNQQAGNGYAGWNMPGYTGILFQFASLDNVEFTFMQQACDEMIADNIIEVFIEDREKPTGLRLLEAGRELYNSLIQ